MNAFERSLKAKIKEELPYLTSYTPGLVIDVFQHGRRRGTVALGQTYEFYDLASLTKIIFTASHAIDFFSLQRKKLIEPIRQALPWWKARSTTPTQLMTHTAGLDWWRPYYKKLHGPMRPALRWNQLLKLLSHEKPSRRGKAIYSDLDLWMIAAYLQVQKEMDLEEMWAETHARLGLGEIFFHPGNKPRYARSRYAPTERCEWRGKVLQGEVHDENTWALGGVAPHAGLFGQVAAVSDWGLKLRAAVRGEDRRWGDPEMVRRFTRRQVPRAIGDWGLCFMKPSRPGASCGKYFSARSFGHTGFTGTSFWLDPVNDVMVVILSNRVHPTRTNAKFVGLRAPLHDWIWELL